MVDQAHEVVPVRTAAVETPDRVVESPTPAGSLPEATLSPAEQAEHAAALQTIHEAIEQGDRMPPATDVSQTELPPIQAPAPLPQERPAAVQTLKQLANRLMSPFRGIMNIIRSIGRWIVK